MQAIVQGQPVQANPIQPVNPRPHQCGPICCKLEMFEMVRRAIVRSDGSLNYCSVWHCLNCGRLLL